MRRLLPAALRRRLRPLRRLVRRRRPRTTPPTLSLHLDGHDRFLRFVDDPRARRRVEVLELLVEPWFEVRDGWTGRLGPLADVRSVETEFDRIGRRARLRIVTSTPVEAVHLVRAAYSVFFATRRTSEPAGPRLGVHPGADADLVVHPGGGLRPVLPAKIGRREYIDFDQAATADGLSRLDRPSQSLQLIERPTGPQVRVNPKVHRPIGRREPTPDMHGAVARTDAGRFVVIGDDGTRLIDLPVAESIGHLDLVALRMVRSIDASGIGTDVASTTRLAEVAAYGQLVHDAPTGLPVHADLSSIWSAPYAPMPLLEHMNRSLGQVRAVMRHHTRVLAVERWPSVSVLLATKRPQFLPAILEQLAAQDHPDLEIVVGCHGFAAPDPSTWSPQIRDRVGPVLEIDASEIFGDVLARVTAAASGDLVSKVDDDDLYGTQHVSDVMTSWVYSDAQLVGRKLALVRDEPTDTLVVRRLFRESYRAKVAGGSMTIAREDLAAIGGWRPQARAVDRGLWTRLEDAGALHYACSGPGYVHVRHAAQHTWSVPLEHFTETYHVDTVQGLPPAALGVLDLVTPRVNSGTPLDG